MVVVVLPQRWTALHEPLNPWCWCLPTIEDVAGGQVVVHNAPGVEQETRWLTVPYRGVRAVLAYA